MEKMRGAEADEPRETIDLTREIAAHKEDSHWDAAQRAAVISKVGETAVQAASQDPK